MSRRSFNVKDTPRALLLKRDLESRRCMFLTVARGLMVLYDLRWVIYRYLGIQLRRLIHSECGGPA